MKKTSVEIYTDGSCNPKEKIGGWAAVILFDGEKIVLQGSETKTTHNRMELTAVIKSIDHVLENIPEYGALKIYTDSQYVERIPTRMEKLLTKDFITKKGERIHNEDLIKQLIAILNSTNVVFIKVKAHQKASDKPNYNREVDKLSRHIVRENVTLNRILSLEKR